MTGNNGRKFGKWHFAGLIALLYVLVVLVCLLTSQPPEITKIVLKEGGGAVALTLFLMFLLRLG